MIQDNWTVSWEHIKLDPHIILRRIHGWMEKWMEGQILSTCSKMGVVESTCYVMAVHWKNLSNFPDA